MFKNPNSVVPVSRSSRDACSSLFEFCLVSTDNWLCKVGIRSIPIKHTRLDPVRTKRRFDCVFVFGCSCFGFVIVGGGGVYLFWCVMLLLLLVVVVKVAKFSYSGVFCCFLFFWCVCLFC